MNLILILSIIYWSVDLHTCNWIYDLLIWCVRIIIFRCIQFHFLRILQVLFLKYITLCRKHVIFRLMQFFSYFFLKYIVPLNALFTHYWLLEFIRNSRIIFLFLFSKFIVHHLMNHVFQIIFWALHYATLWIFID